MRYYLAQVSSNTEEATKNIIYCLAQKPLMAEFWCLLGDCYNKMGMKNHAKEFFKTAIEMGKSRQTDDLYPIELSKYNEYPNKLLSLLN
jgi:Tfp pilus assembly protein PilF